LGHVERSVLLEPLDPDGYAARPAAPRRPHRVWPIGAAVFVLLAIVSAASVSTQLRAAEFDRLEHQWVQVQARSRARIDTETTLLRFVDTAPDRAVSSAMIDTYGNEINFIAQVDQTLRGEFILDHGLRVLRTAMRNAIGLHLSELQAVESFYWDPGLPSQRPTEASRDFLVQSAEVSRLLDEQRRRLGRR
jgi:hypothetical protein